MEVMKYDYIATQIYILAKSIGNQQTCISGRKLCLIKVKITKLE